MAQHAILTGVNTGVLTLDDGTVIDLNEPVLYFTSRKEHDRIAKAIEKAHNEKHNEKD